MGPGDLSDILCGIEIPTDSSVLVGIEGFDDAGVYKLNEEIALVQSIDFFTPVVNDPYWFGQIAASNAMSDIYAMGGIPKTAMNIVCFSPKKFGLEVLKEILRGGIEKIKEAKAVLIGGHSVDDEEMKYGLAVTGIVNPAKVIKNEGARPGDLLVLTKPIGSGILTTAIKAEILKEEEVLYVIRIMAELNDKASRLMLSVGSHAATDVTGFGLIGHLKEMIKENIGVELYVEKVPIMDGALELAKSGFIPGGLYRNRDYFKKDVINLSQGPIYDLLFDPQTSGGLLFAVPEERVDNLREDSVKLGVKIWIIGKFTSENRGKIALL